MEELRQKIESVLQMSNNPIRLTEHSVFNRMIYRSTNQHRKGLYFKQLQHVRRLLHGARTHIAWESLERAIPPVSKSKPDRSGGKRRRNKKPLLLSTLTRDDVTSLMGIMDKLVNVIPAAAGAIASHLIVPGCFLPFAVTMCASLSRLFVMERTVRSTLSAVLLNLNITLGETPLQMKGCPTEVEDIGEVLSLTSSRDDNIPLECPMPVTSSERQDIAKFEQPSGPISSSENYLNDIRNKCPSSKLQQNKVDEAPSLYAMMRESDVAFSHTAKLETKTTVPLPHVEPISERASNKNKKRGRKRSCNSSDPSFADKRMRLQPMTLEIPLTEAAIETNQKDITSYDPAKTQPQDLSVELSRHSQQTPHESGSDSEDIDDIFMSLGSE